MANLFAAISRLDLSGWLRGLFGAGISGGASALAGGIVLPSLDADHFSIFGAKFWIAIGALFSASAIVSIAKFLQTTPLPPMKTVTETRKVVTGEAPGAVVTKMVQEVYEEPIKPDQITKDQEGIK